MFVGFYQGHVLLIREEGEYSLPKVSFESSESLEKTVRREVYSQTGALVETSELFGILKIIKPYHPLVYVNVPIYVGNIYGIESCPAKKQRHLISIDSVCESLKQPYFQKIKGYLLYHAYKLSCHLKK